MEAAQLPLDGSSDAAGATGLAPARSSTDGEIVTGPNGRPANPVFEDLIDLFGMTRPKEGQRWPKTAQQVATCAAEISRIDGPPDKAEIERRAAEYRRRFPKARLTPAALAKHWYDLAKEQSGLVAGDDRRRVTSTYTGWEPAWPEWVGVPIAELAAPPAQPEPGAAFDRDAWFRNVVAEQRRDTAMATLARTVPAWAAHATPASLVHAEPPHHAELLAALKRWVTAPSAVLVLYGPTGGGKTHLACAAAWRLADRGVAPVFFRYTDLMAQMRAEFGARRDWADIPVIERAAAAGLLILDDYGAGRDAPDWEHAAIDALLNRRIDSNKPTIITTNLRADATGPGTITDAMGDRFASRFATGAVLPVPGPDRRVHAMLAASVAMPVE